MGRPLNVIGRAVQMEVERRGLSVMPGVSGHGVGRSIHEDPFVHNYYVPWDNQSLEEGLVIAIEPASSAGPG